MSDHETMETAINAAMLGAAKTTRADKDDLKGIVRRRAKFSRQQAIERKASLKAETERQLSRQFAVEDARWAHVTHAAAAAIAQADAEIARICEASGVNPAFRPRLALSWHERGENADPARRTELRRLMAAFHEENYQQTVSKLERWETETLERVILEGASPAVRGIVDSFPPLDELLPPLSAGDVLAMLPEGDRAREMRSQRWTGRHHYGELPDGTYGPIPSWLPPELGATVSKSSGADDEADDE